MGMPRAWLHERLKVELLLMSRRLPLPRSPQFLLNLSYRAAMASLTRDNNLLTRRAMGDRRREYARAKGPGRLASLCRNSMSTSNRWRSSEVAPFRLNSASRLGRKTYSKRGPQKSGQAFSNTDRRADASSEAESPAVVSIGFRASRWYRARGWAARNREWIPPSRHEGR
jgi:hypothetical protein